MKKSPYVGYSTQEVFKLESNFYCLSMGGDFISQDHSYIFTKSEAEKLYKSTFKELLNIVLDGNQKDGLYALSLIGGLVIEPFRLH